MCSRSVEASCSVATILASSASRTLLVSGIFGPRETSFHHSNHVKRRGQRSATRRFCYKHVFCQRLLACHRTTRSLPTLRNNQTLSVFRYARLDTQGRNRTCFWNL